MASARAQAIANENASIEASQSRALAAREVSENRPRNALEAMASRLHLEPNVLRSTLLNTAFKNCKNEEFVALVVVANEYGLNPMLKEIYAFPAKGGGIVPMVSIDGWIRIMNEHPAFDGIEFDYINDAKGNLDAIEAVIYRKDRNHPIKVIEYLKENARGTEPWKQMPSRMLRHRALIQGARIAFGFSGIVGEGDEIEITGTAVPSVPSRQSLGEMLDDEIPALKGAQVDSETGEVTTDERGMTEVSEEEARRLDAGQVETDNDSEIEGTTEERPDDADPGEPIDAPPYAAKVAELQGGIEAARTKPALKKVEDEFLKHHVSLPKEVADELELAIGRKRRELSGEGGQ